MAKSVCCVRHRLEGLVSNHVVVPILNLRNVRDSSPVGRAVKASQCPSSDCARGGILGCERACVRAC